MLTAEPEKNAIPRTDKLLPMVAASKTEQEEPKLDCALTETVDPKKA